MPRPLARFRSSPPGIEAPGARSGRPEEEKQVTEQNRGFHPRLFEAWPESARRPRAEVRYSHLARQDERHGTGKQPEDEQWSAGDFKPAGKASYRHDVAVDTAAPDAEDLLQPVHQEQAACGDPQHAEGDGRPFRVI